MLSALFFLFQYTLLFLSVFSHRPNSGFSSCQCRLFCSLYKRQISPCPSTFRRLRRHAFRALRLIYTLFKRTFAVQFISFTINPFIEPQPQICKLSPLRSHQSYYFIIEHSFCKFCFFFCFLRCGLPIFGLSLYFERPRYQLCFLFPP